MPPLSGLLMNLGIEHIYAIILRTDDPNNCFTSSRQLHDQRPFNKQRVLVILKLYSEKKQVFLHFYIYKLLSNLCNHALYIAIHLMRSWRFAHIYVFTIISCLRCIGNSQMYTITAIGNSVKRK